MKIGILTLPLHTNYGGLLQAYALQKTLESLGHKVVVLDTDKHPNIRPWYLRPALWGYYAIQKFIKRKDVEIFQEKRLKRIYEEYLVTSKNTQSFIDTYIHLRIYKKLSEIKRNEFNAIVVGSDQVWRKKYFFGCCIRNAFLYFTIGWNIKRVAYAASFGVEKWEYNKKETAECKKAIMNFDAISVREDVGVELCSEYLGVEALHVLDPTMLLCKEDYEKIVREGNSLQSDGTMLTYVIDESEQKSNIVTSIAKAKGLKPFRVNSQFENISANLNDRIQPSVQQWLRGFLDADFVITDSFHACVFSIIFNKPFVVIGNKSRGLSRFNSLLSMFGLEDHLIMDIKDLDVEKNYEIPSSVYGILNHQKELSLQFLKNNLPT